MLATDGKGVHEQLTLHATGVFYLVHDAHIHFLPEAGHAGHTRRVRLTHRLLHLLRVGVDNHRGTLRQRQDGPAALENMGIGQEVHHTVVLIDRHALAISLKGGMELRMRQDDTLGVTCGTAGIEDVGNVVERCLLLAHLHLRLARQVLAKLQEVAEIKSVGVVRGDMHQGVEDDDTL